jgi:hypothetical protein
MQKGGAPGFAPTCLGQGRISSTSPSSISARSPSISFAWDATLLADDRRRGLVGESVGWLVTLLSPGGIPDDATEVHSFEGRIERSEYVVVHGAKGRLRLVFESLVEAMDDTFLEVASSRMRREDLLALRIGELRIADSAFAELHCSILSCIGGPGK